MNISGKNKPSMQGGKGVLTGSSKQVAAILETACSLRSLTDGELAETVRHAALQQAEWQKTDGTNMSRVEAGAGVVGMDTLRRVTMAAVCEAARRVLGFIIHPNQVKASLVMTSRCVVEMPTGEGKTLSAVLTAVWLGLGGEGVHILTFNDYLANRDFQWMGPICRLLGRTTGCVAGTSTQAERQEAYRADVVWLTAREAGFDHLRDGLAMSPEELVQRPFHAAIVDEADSLLIDEARIPMVLAGGLEGEVESVWRICQAVAALSRDADLILDRNEQQVTLSDSGIGKMERFLGVENLYADETSSLLARVHAALTARFLIRLDIEYIIRDGRILLVDPHTGRIAANRHWPVLLQEALEVKEGLAVSRNGSILGTVTTQHFLGMYPCLSGMTGTARTSAGELEQVYKLKVVQVAAHLPCIRMDHPDIVYPARSEKWDAVCRETTLSHGKGRPVLIGTVDVAESEAFAQRLLAEGIPCRILNARNDAEEAVIIAEAGMPGAVTVSTNMAGRGVDIRLGGSNQQMKGEAVAAGGLLILGTARHEHRRVDMQLRGRSGRQGDPGESRFHISLEDDLFVRNGFSELLAERMKMRMREGIADWNDAALTKAFDIGQRMVEGYHEDIRHQLAKYAEMPEQQRQAVRKARMAVLRGVVPEPSIRSRLPDLYETCVAVSGQEAMTKLERRLWLTLLDKCWADYLEEVASLREGVHLAAFGNLNPLDVFHKEIISLYDAMWRRHGTEVAEWFSRMMTVEGEFLENMDGPSRPSATWTYLVLDTPDQFSRLPQLVKATTAAVSAPMLALLAWYDRWKSKRRAQLEGKANTMGSQREQDKSGRKGE